VSVSAVRAAEVPAQATLTRRLGPIDASAIIISNVIGGSIFYVPVLVARLTPSATAMLGVWLFGGLLAFAGAMAYAELATLRPHAGGEYVYLRDAYGGAAAFLSGWTSFVAGFSGAIAAGAVALADYVGRFVPAASDRTPLLTLPMPFVSLTVTPQAIVAIGTIAGLSMIHLHGSGRIVHNLLAGIKVSALAVFIAIGCPSETAAVTRKRSSHRHPRRATPAGSGHVQLLAGMRPPMWPRRLRPESQPRARSPLESSGRALHGANLLFHAMPSRVEQPARWATDDLVRSGCLIRGGDGMRSYDYQIAAEERDGVTGPRVLRDGARSRVPRVGGEGAMEAPDSRAIIGPGCGVQCWFFRAHSPTSLRIRASRLFCFPGLRCLRSSCCGGGSPVRIGRSGRSVIR
jgi:hypothetical protein